MARSDTRKKGVSLAKGPVGLLGAAMLAWGILSLVLGGNTFASSPVSGTVQGDSLFGLEGNGWTNLLWIAAGALLLFGAPLHWGAKTMALLVGLALGAASVISMFDGEDVFGIFAANGPTMLAWGAASVALLLLSLLPRVGKDKGRDEDARRREAEMRAPARERVVERERVAEPRVHTPAREPVADEGQIDRPGRFARTEDEVGGHGQEGRVVAPADGDGPRDHGRNAR